MSNREGARVIERFIRWLYRFVSRYDYLYTGDLPDGYPLPGSEFVYHGMTGYIQFYCVRIHWGKEAEIAAVVTVNGTPNLIYSIDQVRNQPARERVI